MGRNWAIAIGINYYYNLQPLKYAQRDAKAMENWFKRSVKNFFSEIEIIKYFEIFIIST
ncbi:hypothetical protein [Rivularia sp. UHCC 0363]|uniref:hypothetical protein n=1 Tax=Rivularia sp. UHCC 0363 TaxID=3110244 RepID=UPI002B205D56|nr:hypothetical protein [Rivularia sp. UHCC 0363]MEA5593788.1 hypothetical protein [Rivularia sp. UHCC 0363]